MVRGYALYLAEETYESDLDPSKMLRLAGLALKTAVRYFSKSIMYSFKVLRDRFPFDSDKLNELKVVGFR